LGKLQPLTIYRDAVIIKQRPPRPTSVSRQVSYRAAPPCAINQRLKPLELLEVWQPCAYLRIVERRRDGVKGDWFAS
jgi:hypothetical protein